MTQTPRTEAVKAAVEKDKDRLPYADFLFRMVGELSKHSRTIELETIELKRQLAEAQRDAERWNALLNCRRIRVLGHAGFNEDLNGYKHIGLELWTKHQAETIGNAKELITEFADAAIQEQKK